MYEKIRGFKITCKTQVEIYFGVKQVKVTIAKNRNGVTRKIVFDALPCSCFRHKYVAQLFKWSLKEL